jgi:hypothetical protein
MGQSQNFENPLRWGFENVDADLNHHRKGVENYKPGLQSILKDNFFHFFFTSHKISIGDRRACRFSALERTILAKQRPKCTVRRRPSTGGGQPSEKFGHFGQFWTRMGFSPKKHYFSGRLQLWTKVIYSTRQCSFGHTGTLSNTRVL